MTATKCNGCGDCCDPVVLPYTQLEARLDPDIDAATRHWVLHDLTPVHPREAKRKLAWLDGQIAVSKLNGNTVLYSSYYSCRWFDTETRRCTNYENRPPPCQGYPWHGREPVEAVALSPRCSFNADLGRPVAAP